MLYKIKEGKEGTFLAGPGVILNECNQEQLKEIYKKDKRFIEEVLQAPEAVEEAPVKEKEEKKEEDPVVETTVPEEKKRNTKKKPVKKAENTPNE